MKNREPYNLRRPLFIWSLGLSLFSFVGIYNCSIPHWRLLITEGFQASVCGKLMHNGSPGLWMWLFVLSKAPELIDTYFIMLRKQKLIFLHWYHHITVFIYSWYHFTKQIYVAQWFCNMNYTVHAVMYLYYAVRASGYYRPPKWVNMFITVLQLAQMFMGVAVIGFIYHKMSDPSWRCDGTMETTFFYVYCSFAMYFSYFVLFVHFFYSTYMKPPPKSSNDKKLGTAPVNSKNSFHKLNGHVHVE